MPETLLTVEDVAMRLRVGKTTVYELLAHGGLKAIKIGRCRRIPESALNAWIVKQISAQSMHSVPERGCRTRAVTKRAAEQLGVASSCREEGPRAPGLAHWEWSICLLSRAEEPQE